MKKLLYLISACLILAACQKKQYYTSSPEIDLLKKANEAYFKGDWETLRAAYADTAKIWVNTLPPETPLTPDQMIEAFKRDVSALSEYHMGENPVYEMVITDTGEKWIHCWLLWSGELKNGKEYSSPVHLASQVKDNKIVFNFILFDGLPGYLAALSSDSTLVNP